MPNQPQQPTILVRKADGTTVRMTLEEVKKMKQGNPAKDTSSLDAPKAPVPAPEKTTPKAPPKNAPAAAPLSVSTSSHDLATTAPVKDIFVDKAKAATRRAVADSAPATKTIMPEAPFVPKPETAEPAPASSPKRPPMKKESVLSEPQAPAAKPKPVAHSAKSDKERARLLERMERPSLRQTILSKDVLEKLRGAQPPATKTDMPEPAPQRPQPSPSKPLMHPQARPMPKKGPGKPVLHDVTAPASRPAAPSPMSVSAGAPSASLPRTGAPAGTTAGHSTPPAPKQTKQTMDPVDELRALTLKDFRRLSPDPKQATTALAQKMDTFKNESFLLYIDAVHAFRQSPLYRDYQERILSSLEQLAPIAAFAQASSSSETLAKEDILALAAFGKTLAV